MVDLKRLYEDAEILLYFVKIREDKANDVALPHTDRTCPYRDIAKLKGLALLKRLDSFLAEFPIFHLNYV